MKKKVFAVVALALLGLCSIGSIPAIASTYKMSQEPSQKRAAAVTRGYDMARADNGVLLFVDHEERKPSITHTNIRISYREDESLIRSDLKAFGFTDVENIDSVFVDPNGIVYMYQIMFHDEHGSFGYKRYNSATQSYELMKDSIVLCQRTESENGIYQFFAMADDAGQNYGYYSARYDTSGRITRIEDIFYQSTYLEEHNQIRPRIFKTFEGFLVDTGSNGYGWNPEYRKEGFFTDDTAMYYQNKDGIIYKKYTMAGDFTLSCVVYDYNTGRYVPAKNSIEKVVYDNGNVAFYYMGDNGSTNPYFTGWQKYDSNTYLYIANNIIRSKAVKSNGVWKCYDNVANTNSWIPVKSAWRNVGGTQFYFDKTGISIKAFNEKTLKCNYYENGGWHLIKNMFSTLNDGYVYFFGPDCVIDKTFGWKTSTATVQYMVGNKGYVVAKRVKNGKSWTNYAYDYEKKSFVLK